MEAQTEIPEEDKLLCKHYWVDLYGSDGIDRYNPRIAHIAFYCRHCLQIVVKSYSQERYFMRREFLEEYEQDNGLAGAADG